MVENSLEIPEGWRGYHYYPKMENPKGWGGGSYMKFPPFVGVWIFSGTTHSEKGVNKQWPNEQFINVQLPTPDY